MSTNSSSLFGVKLKHIRQMNNLKQSEIAALIGVSRVNWSSLENGRVQPTKVFINCVSLMFGIDKDYLTNDNRTEMNIASNSAIMLKTIMEKYELLNDDFKGFVEKQIVELIEIQSKHLEKKT